MSTVLILTHCAQPVASKAAYFNDQRLARGLPSVIPAAMFDLTAESARRPLQERSFGSSAVAILAHLAGLTILIAIPVSRAINVQVETPTIEAFVVLPEVLQPPSAPAPPMARPQRGKSDSVVERQAAPSEPPVDIQPEPDSAHRSEPDAAAEGGVEGGTPGGVIGGVVGGIEGPAAPAKPPPAPSPARSPLRTSGAIKPPNLLHRVEPAYSAIAAASHISGIVILEAVVDVGGSVESVKVLRSGGALLDRAAIDALKQWRYAPLVIADLPTPFVVAVTFNFRVPGVRGAN